MYVNHRGTCVKFDQTHENEGNKKSSYIIIIIITITIIIPVILSMQSIYNYIPVTNHVSRVHSVAAVLYLQSVLHVTLFCPCNMFVLSH